MPGNYNNNNGNLDNGTGRSITTTTRAISLVNTESELGATRLVVSYFNRLMKIAIQPKTTPTNSAFIEFDKDAKTLVFLSPLQCKMLHDGFRDILNKKSSFHSVHLETKYGLVSLSDGVDKGILQPYISLSYIPDESSDKTPHTEYYEFKKTGYTLAVDYHNGEYGTVDYPSIELEWLLTTFEEYFKASTYAYAAIAKEAELYATRYSRDVLKAIAGKMDINLSSFLNGGNRGTTDQRNNFLNKSQNQQPQPVGFDPATAPKGGLNGIPLDELSPGSFEEFTQASGISSLYDED